MNFDFHNLLFPEEFENLCRDILEIREKHIEFTTYRRGKDGGIDFKSINTTSRIIGQCKLYNPNNYAALRSALKEEADKCKRQKPDRYILCINYNLNRDEADEILRIFGNYIIEEKDIIDGIKLNKYLSHPDYKHLTKTYSKLLVPNLNFIESALENIVKKKYYNKTKSFFATIAKKHKLFHNTKILKDCIDRLEKNKVLILTGNPGVGKTTTAKMIANYFLHQNNNVLFLEHNDFIEIEGLKNENQLIIVDDFWGQNFSPELNNNSMLRQFNRIIKDYKNYTNQYLLLTSREYIIKDVFNNSEFQTKEILEKEKYLINLNEYSEEDKVKILLNHLLYYDLSKRYFTYLKFNDTLESIIHHQNYSPRHIEYFINQHLRDKESNEYNFYKEFYKYLDSPQDYWNINFNILSDTSQLILLIILISSDPIYKIDLEKSFAETQETVRRFLNKNIQPTEFDNEIKLLEDFYIVSDKDEYSNQILIRFQNPGIKDFLLEYLRTEGKLWITPLIENAPYLNQLHFIFNTADDEIEDYDSDTFFYGKKIVLSEKNQTILKQRLIKEFHSLNYCNPESRDYTDQFTKYNNSDETKYWKIILLNNLFKINDEKNIDIRIFVLNEVQKDIELCYSENCKLVDAHSMIYFPNIVGLIRSFTTLNKQKIIYLYHSSITFTKEFDSFYEFKNIFTDEFNDFLKEHIGSIRRNIRYLIIDDIDYYQWHDMDNKLDIHLHYYIEEVRKKYGMRFSKEFVQEIEDMVERPFRNFPKPKVQKKKKASKRKKNESIYENFKPKKFDKIIDSYLPKDEKEFSVLKYLKTHVDDKELINRIRKDLKSKDSLLNLFTENQVIFSEIIKFVQNENVDLNSYNYYTFFNAFFTYYVTSTNIGKETLEDFFFELAKDSFEHDYSITSTQIQKLVKSKKLLIENHNRFYPIIIPDNNWFKFSVYYFKVFFIIQYIIHIEDDELFREEIIHYSYYLYEHNLLRILDLACHKRLLNTVVFPELERFISQIDSTSEKSIVLSIIKFFQIEFELEWIKNEKTFEVTSSSNSESFIEFVLEYLNVNFNTCVFDIYFSKEYYSEENVNEYCIKKVGYNSLYDQIIRNIVPIRKTTFLNKKEGDYFDIKLFDFASKEDNYSLLKDVGIEKYLVRIFNETKDKLK